MKPGRSKRQDYDYECKGTCVVFMAYDLDRGIRYGEVRASKTKADYAAFIDKVLEQQAEQIELGPDNLNTHPYGSFYEHLPLERAAELRKKIRFPYTPKYGSWLNRVEIEFAARSRQCFRERVAASEQLQDKLTPWLKERNDKQVKSHGSFTSNNVREKLKAQYQNLT